MIRETLAPTMEHLCAQHVLVQAWKKSTKYIRDHNWYADTLALDISAARLLLFIEQLQEELINNQWINDPLQMIPAPKSQEWTIEDGKWNPKEKKDKKKIKDSLRPLAHVSLRDQVIATAAMLCLADRVESAQGNTTLDCTTAENRSKVISYGNRLYCDEDSMEEGKLYHRWGSSKLYRSYYLDYRSFIRRPEAVAIEYKKLNSGRVAIVQTDISKFYDRVRPEFLHEKLDRFCVRRGEKPFHRFLVQLLNWQWQKGIDERHAERYAKGAGLNDFDRIALPQGLVAAGFFANVSLIDFDNAMLSAMNTEIRDNLILVDVCRYVDDIRLVIEVQNSMKADDVKDSAKDWLTDLLNNNAQDLVINEKKTSVAFIGESERTLIRQSQRMERIQQSVSGGFDVTGGMDVLAEIESLFRGQEQFGDESIEGRFEWPFMVVPDVRDETVARFGANRFRKTFRSLRPLLEDVAPSAFGTCLEEEDSVPEIVFTKEQLDAQARAFANGLIERWLRDPSHVRILRVALDIYPDKEMLTYLLGLLWHYIEKTKGKKEPRLIALYCLSEIFRAGATETGFVEDAESLPSGIDISEYRSILRDNATKILDYATAHPNSLPWYLLQQVLLFMCTDNPEQTASYKLPGGRLIAPYRDFINFLAGNEVSNSALYTTYCIMALRSFPGDKRMIDVVKKAVTSKRIDRLAQVDVGCAEYLLEQSPELQGMVSELTLFQLGLKSSIPLDRNRKERFLHLGQVAHSVDNPLRQEIEILQLVTGWLQHINTHKDGSLSGFYPDYLKVSLRPSASLLRLEKSKVSGRNIPKVPYILPQYVKTVGTWRWALGSLIMFAVTGSASPIPLKSITQAKGIKYRPTTSEWVARFFGGYFGRDRLGDPSLPMSTWMDEFLLRLLAWPGCTLLKERDIKPGKLKTMSQVLQLCREHYQKLKTDRGSSSGMVFLHEHVRRRKPDSKSTDKSIRVCIAQTVRPILEQFDQNYDCDTSDPEFNRPAVRRDLRRHLRAILSGISQMLIVRDTHRDRGHRLDWLILPELSVHTDDIRPILVPFVRQHKCVVMAGLIYHRIAAARNLVNEALWLIPSWNSIGSLNLHAIYQGKEHLAPEEVNTFGGQIQGHRPCQWIMDYHWSSGRERPLKLTGSICYDATDLRLASDLRERSDIYAISAYNKDVSTFDTMTQALHYHMYQMVILANNGTFGGSNAYLPYRAQYKRQIFHVHGQPQVAISFLEIDDPMELINRGEGAIHMQQNQERIWKHPPAGWKV